MALFVDKLEQNLKRINFSYQEICQLFKSANITHFDRLPDDKESCGQFAKLFKQLNEYLEAATIQGFHWDQLTYTFKDEDDTEHSFQVDINEQTYLILALRYKELFGAGGGGGSVGGNVPFEIEGYLTEIDTDKIDSDYMNNRFEKYLKSLNDGTGKSTEDALNDLHRSFAALNQEEQKIANIFLHAIQRGDVQLSDGKSFRDYITEYQFKAKEDEIHAISNSFGLDETKLRQLINAHVNENNIDEFGRFGQLLNSVDKVKAKQYFENEESNAIPPFKVNVKVAAFLKEFILKNSNAE